MKKFDSKKISWRKRQEDFIRFRDREKNRKKKIIKKIFILSFLIILVSAAFQSLNRNQNEYQVSLESDIPNNNKNKPNKKDSKNSNDIKLKKEEIAKILDASLFLNLKEKSFKHNVKGQEFNIESTIDKNLQKFIVENLDLSNTKQLGIVVMEPDTGRILSMVSFDKKNPQNNACLDLFPAASVFKIITASAAIEQCGFTPDSKIAFTGRKHTLYKSQLKSPSAKDIKNSKDYLIATNESNKKNYQNITFGDSFAQSINPVFAKIGIYLGKETLEQYTNSFGFNKDFNFEIKYPKSPVFLTPDEFKLGEIASGFNKETLISPLHGALIVASILNEGRLVEPTIIDKITDKNNKTIYKSQMAPLNEALSPEASRVISQLMLHTVDSGTCRKNFKDLQKDSILSKLNIGGKTGSINEEAKVYTRCDWFVGFAEEKEGSKKLVISGFISHEKFIGPKASYYARLIIKEYFGNYFNLSIAEKFSAKKQ